MVSAWIGYLIKFLKYFYFLQNWRTKKLTNGLVFFFIAFCSGSIHFVVLLDIIFLKGNMPCIKGGCKELKKIPDLEKWGTGRVGGVSRVLLSTLLRVYFVKWVQISGSNLKVSNKLLIIPLLLQKYVEYACIDICVISGGSWVILLGVPRPPVNLEND